MHEQLRLASAAMDRSINAQAEFWIKIGLLAELNPHLPSIVAAKPCRAWISTSPTAT